MLEIIHKSGYDNLAMEMLVSSLFFLVRGWGGIEAHHPKKYVALKGYSVLTISTGTGVKCTPSVQKERCFRIVSID
jgi:hypothetical protein